DGTQGIVAPWEAVLNTTTNIWSTDGLTVCDWPDRVTVRYLAGYPLGSDGQMQEPFRTAVARLAAAELARPVCGCESANRELARWQFDLARSGGANDEMYGAVSAGDLDNPFGTRRGHVHAWRLIRNRQRLQGVLALHRRRTPLWLSQARMRLARKNTVAHLVSAAALSRPTQYATRGRTSST